MDLHDYRDVAENYDAYLDVMYAERDNYEGFREFYLELAKKHGKTTSQIILRWHLQDGNIAIPRSSNPAHIKENISIFDFALDAEDMQRMASLDKQQRFSTF